jgi:hypothetical protein
MPMVLDRPGEVEELEELGVGEPPVDQGDGDDGDGGAEGPWVTVGTYWHPTAAHLAQIRLEAEGIDSILLDENVTVTLWGNAVGGIKLQVRASEAAKAREILHEVVARAREQVATASGEVRCPGCGSAETSPVRRPSVALLVAATIASFGLLLVALPWLLAVPGRWRRCTKCGHGWRVSEVGFPVEH